MMIVRRILCLCVVFSFLVSSITPPPVFAQSVSIDSIVLPFKLPKPGIRVNLSPAFDPVLIKGLKVHPENPFLFDFIVDPGQDKLSADEVKKISQRMVNYFLASLTIPEKDLWVNLSPVEKNHIIPDSLNKTELGRDLLAEDYMLKQVGASLIYPESRLGKKFWSKVYDEAYRKFGVTQIPVDVFNKIWIVPEKASVFERGDTVYIVNAHLKVMLEEDLLAKKILGQGLNQGALKVGAKDISKQVLREIVLPAIEKAVNENKNFAQLRQIFYSLILAQWYQDEFKGSILNKIYSGRKKMAGIDVSDPKNKELIYQKYLSAYRKGVFNYIKEETDKVSQQPVPRKYFSGGFVDQPIHRTLASESDFNRAMSSVANDQDLTVDLKPSTEIEPRLIWDDLNRPLHLSEELKGLVADGKFDRKRLYAFIDRYSAQVASQRLYPVQGAWPVLKAITLLTKSEEKDLVAALKSKYPKGNERPELVDKILLMNHFSGIKRWLVDRAPNLVGRRIYLVAAEIHHWAGGLGPVMKFHGKGMKNLGADVEYIEPRYQYSLNGVVEKSRFSGIFHGAEILEHLIENGLVQEVSPTEIRPNLRGSLQRYQVEKAELDWNDIVQKLTDNEHPWAQKISPTEILITANLETQRNRMAGVFGKDFWKVSLLLQRSQTMITERAVHEIAQEDASKLWDILKQPLDYTNPNIGIKDLQDDVDHFIVEMGDINRNGIVVKQAFSSPEIWVELKENGYIDSMGEIQSKKLGDKYTDMVLPNRTDTEKKQIYDILQHVRSNGIQQSWVQVSTGIDENGIKVNMFRDVQADGVSSYYTKMLYNYKGRDNPVGKEESMAFINVASAELIKRLETKRMQEQKASWKPAVVHGNDGQFAPLQAVTMSRHGTDDAVKNIFWAFTTHTYRNRGGNGNAHWAINTFLKHMMGINDRYINAFRQGDNYIDYTSGGVRLANWAGAVSDKQRDDMAGKDPNVTLTAVTNGAVPEEMAAVYREEFKKLQQAGVISADADYERPTALEDALVKRASKQRLNQAKIKTANGGVVEVDLDRPLLGYERRLVLEKAGRERALTDDNIWMLVKLGYNVVLMGNHQGTEESERLAAGLRDLEKKIDEEKRSERAAQYPGRFQFVQSFSPQEKKYFLAAADVQVQDSDNHTGAAEFTEEDISSTGGLQAGPNYNREGEGVIIAQGIPLDFEHPGRGQTLMPKEDTAKSWLETVYIPLMRLWEKSPDHIEFYENAALSPRLNRIQSYLIASATYLREYDRVIERQKQEARVDEDTQAKIVQAIGDDQGAIKGILTDGRNGVAPFIFKILGQEDQPADGSGLMAFMDKKDYLENRYGYDVFLHHYLDAHFQSYLRGLFGNTGPAVDLLNNWIKNLEDESGPSTQERAIRLGKFIEDLVRELQAKQSPANPSAAMVAPGGIKFEHIDLERHGSLMANVINDQALEDMFLKARGLYGDIIGITPIPNLGDFIR